MKTCGTLVWKWRWLGILGLALIVACSPAATSAPQPTEAPSTSATSAPAATQELLPTVPAQETSAGAASTATPPPIGPTLTPIVVEGRVIELEWPMRLRLGDSDSVRLTLVATQEGYVITQEFPDNEVLTQTVNVARPAGYELFGVARLESVGFAIAPAAEQVTRLPVGETVTWRWTLTPRTAGQQRLTVNLFLRWEGPEIRESQIYSRALTLQVMSFLGLTTGQSMWLGVLGLMVGSGLSVAALLIRPRSRRVATINPALAIEPPPGLKLTTDEETLVRMVFHQYARVVIETEFRSGYSGARALLARPIRGDGRADAHTILKIGPQRAIEREYENYQRFVKDTLPPITARVQDEVALPLRRTSHPRAALRYTFIAQPGQRPLSLREALRQNPDPAILQQLFENFGPNWWQQRCAHTFRLAQEYDGLLPAHLTLTPIEAGQEKELAAIDEHTSPRDVDWPLGAVVRVGRFAEVEQRQDGRSLALMGVAQAGQPPLRLRWRSLTPPSGTLARITATRATLLHEFTANLDLLGLPNPLPRLPDWLNETVVGTQSTIHGDLNLENVLVGPGGFVWLIDFAQTRDGHPLLDFAHLETEIIAHILAPQFTASQYLALWQSEASQPPLLTALHTIAARCLANSAQPREYDLALALACLGALKYPNLDPHARHLLFLTAARLGQRL